jgi:uncharacterized protein (UPF0548 family)
MLDADNARPSDVPDDRVVVRWATGDTPSAWREIEIDVELGEGGDRDRRCRHGLTGWAAVQAVGPLVVWERGELVARRAAPAAAP